MNDPQISAIEIADVTREISATLPYLQRVLQRAHQKVIAAKEIRTKLEASHKKIDLISEEMSKQFSSIRTIYSTLNAHNAQLFSNLETAIQASERILNELTLTLQLLNDTNLHPALATDDIAALLPPLSAGSGAHEVTATSIALKRTLHDFVNVESVSLLKLQARTEVDSLKQLRSSCAAILDGVTQLYERLTARSESMLSSMKELQTRDGVHQSTANPQSSLLSEFNIGEEDLDIISKIVLEVSSTHDRLHYQYSILTSKDSIGGNRQQQQLGTRLDMNEVRDWRSSLLPQYIQQINERFKAIEQKCADIEKRYNRYSHFYQSAVLCLGELEKFSPLIQLKLRQIEESETIFHEQQQNSLDMFTEMHDLTDWYKLFIEAYHKLIPEIERRNAANRRMQEYVDMVSKQLAAMYQEEQQQRTQFAEQFGVYLPPTLCPAILESATQFQIVPERINSMLPTVSSTQQPTSSDTQQLTNDQKHRS